MMRSSGKENKGKKIGSAHMIISLRSLQALAECEDLQDGKHPELRQALTTFWQEIVLKTSQEDVANQKPSVQNVQAKDPKQSGDAADGNVCEASHEVQASWCAVQQGSCSGGATAEVLQGQKLAGDG